MAPSRSSSISEDELRAQLFDAGNHLIAPPSSKQALLCLLDKVENLLSKVRQDPSSSMEEAVLPVAKALVADELVRHEDINVKVSVASCISEITRVMAPDAPYNDEQIKNFFQLTVVAFEKLFPMTGRCYSRAVSILKAFATFRLCVVMLDLELDALIEKMFQQFLKTIRPEHPPDVFANMEKIMTLVVQQSEDVASELLILLLTSVKNENQFISPISWMLGKKVLENCATKLKPYLPEAVRATGLALDDYADVVTSICQDTSGKENLEFKELAVDDDDGKTILVINNGPAQSSNDNTSDDRKSHKTLERSHETSTDVRNEQSGNSDGSKSVEEQELESVAIRKKRDRKPNTLMKPEEGYDYSWLTMTKKYLRPSNHTKIPRKKKILPSGSEKETQSPVCSPKSLLNGDLRACSSKNDSFPDGVHSKRDKVRKLVPIVEKHPDLDLSASKGELLTLVEKKDSECTSVKLKKESKGKGNAKAKCGRKVTGNITATKTNGVHKSPVQLKDAKKQSGSRTDSMKDEEYGDQDMASHSVTVDGKKLYKASKGKRKRKRNPKMEEDVVSHSTTKSLTGDGKQIDKLSKEKRKRKCNPTEEGDVKSKRGMPLREYIIATMTFGDVVEETGDQNVASHSKTNPKSRDENNSGKASKAKRKRKPKSQREEGDEKPKSERALTGNNTAIKTDGVHNCPQGKVVSAVRSTDYGKLSGASTVPMKKEAGGQRMASHSTTKSLRRDESKVDKASKAKHKRSHNPHMDEASKITGSVKGEKLVGSKIKVWWPKDKMFYDGVVTSFDHSKTKHQVLYDDGDEELLDLRRQKWQLVQDDVAPDQGRGAIQALNTSDSDHKSSNDVHDFAGGASKKKHKSVNDGRSKSKSYQVSSNSDSGSEPSQKPHKIRKIKSQPNEVLPDNASKAIVEHAPTLCQTGSCSRSNSWSSEDSEDQKMPRPEIEEVHGYKVKASAKLTLQAIFTKYGDIAADCRYKSVAVRSSLLEVICDVVQRLQNDDVKAVVSEINAIENEVADAEDANLQVSWMRDVLAEFRKSAGVCQRLSLLGEAKITTALVIKAARKDRRQRKMELEKAQQRFDEAHRCVEALEFVSDKIEDEISELKAEENVGVSALDELS